VTAPLDPCDHVADRPARALVTLLDQLFGHVRLGRYQGRQLGMEGFDEPAGLGIGQIEQCCPLRPLERGRSENRRRDRQPVGDEILQQPERQRQCGDGAGSRGAQGFFDPRRVPLDRCEPFAQRLAVNRRSGAGDEVDQLAPAHGGVARVARRLPQHRLQSIVEPHQEPCHPSRARKAVSSRRCRPR